MNRKNNMKLFLDTEFTKLEHRAQLISIALVDENEEFFYAELTDNYNEYNCSDFVKLNVLPYLFGGEYKMTFNECEKAIIKWIKDRNCDCMIACDNIGWDMPYLESLIYLDYPKNLDKNKFFYVREDKDLAEKVIKDNDYFIHNALHDAMVMKKAHIK
jgi:hypothetical protein